MKIKLNKFIGNVSITSIVFNQRLLGSTVEYFHGDSKMFETLYADAPEVIRDVIQSYQKGESK